MRDGVGNSRLLMCYSDRRTRGAFDLTNRSIEMKKFLFLLAAASGISVASAGVTTGSLGVSVTVLPSKSLTGEPQVYQVSNPLPPIIGSIKNRAGGQIILATEKCSTDPSLQFAFVKDDGGRLSLTGCWQMIGEDIIIKWSDGDVFSYPVGSIEFSDGFNRWSEQNARDKARERTL